MEIYFQFQESLPLLVLFSTLNSYFSSIVEKFSELLFVKVDLAAILPVGFLNIILIYENQDRGYIGKIFFFSFIAKQLISKVLSEEEDWVTNTPLSSFQSRIYELKSENPLMNLRFLLQCKCHP